MGYVRGSTGNKRRRSQLGGTSGCGFGLTVSQDIELVDIVIDGDFRQKSLERPGIKRALACCPTSGRTRCCRQAIGWRGVWISGYLCDSYFREDSHTRYCPSVMIRSIRGRRWQADTECLDVGLRSGNGRR